MGLVKSEANYYDMTERERTFRHATGKLFYKTVFGLAAQPPQVRWQPLSEVPAEVHTNGNQNCGQVLRHNASADEWSETLAFPSHNTLSLRPFILSRYKIVVARNVVRHFVPQTATTCSQPNPTYFVHTFEPRFPNHLLSSVHSRHVNLSHSSRHTCSCSSSTGCFPVEIQRIERSIATPALQLLHCHWCVLHSICFVAALVLLGLASTFGFLVLTSNVRLPSETAGAHPRVCVRHPGDSSRSRTLMPRA